MYHPIFGGSHAAGDPVGQAFFCHSGSADNRLLAKETI
jgi:hypothetical protein